MKTLLAKSFNLTITQDLIAEATQKNSNYCMIAQALRYRGASSTNVTAETVRFNLDGVRYSYPLPAKAAAELLKFDDGKSVKPSKLKISANTGFASPIRRSPKGYVKGPHRKKAAKSGVKQSTRRYQGLRMLENTNV